MRVKHFREDSIMIVLVLFGLFLLLAIAALRWGYDSRDGFEYQNARCKESLYR